MKESWGRSQSRWNLRPGTSGTLPGCQQGHPACRSLLDDATPPNPKQPRPRSKGRTLVRTAVSWLRIQATFHWEKTGLVVGGSPTGWRDSGVLLWLPPAPRDSLPWQLRSLHPRSHWARWMFIYLMLWGTLGPESTERSKVSKGWSWL